MEAFVDQCEILGAYCNYCHWCVEFLCCDVISLWACLSAWALRGFARLVPSVWTCKTSLCTRGAEFMRSPQRQNLHHSVWGSPQTSHNSSGRDQFSVYWPYRYHVLGLASCPSASCFDPLEGKTSSVIFWKHLSDLSEVIGLISVMSSKISKDTVDRSSRTKRISLALLRAFRGSSRGHRMWYQYEVLYPWGALNPL